MFLINRLEHLREVVHLIKLNLETPLIPNDGIEERNGLLTLSKESTVQGVKYFIKTIMKKIPKKLHRTKIIKKLITRINIILQEDDELKIIKELEEIIYEIDNKKLNYQFMCYTRITQHSNE
ncbi:20879_t:CDS:1 [Gigaspora margarita]|uniref:20879_t:CDS:1 n=1 Tax=Gigaspora margarita TaxID=4874 RepID=A0ABN7W1R9_GIGMA|nr:20879_t:CDS:1 [Gigaspora margarita]